ncbi:uncharacterized protein EI90DRAFT_532982 [Cantharellus anzutake]|uniref:uncharacterized protein n=1 Tax=Cantharellus anzutake TaxID=1750568 RepID=UPI0019066491|nr:uncharacterized protein EI90DRAFT_532982 [Cantharellus anzutake]KAF8334287.1 hypothetical protein EI90DRAFT_532982 [Cantharellus anzutake]
MQSAAERARERRRLEEEEREKEKGRARKKAESIAALMEGTVQSATAKPTPSVTQAHVDLPPAVLKPTLRSENHISSTATGTEGPVWRTRSRAGSQRNEKNKFPPQHTFKPLSPAKENVAPALLPSPDKLDEVSQLPDSEIIAPTPRATLSPISQSATVPTEGIKETWQSTPGAAPAPRPATFNVADVTAAFYVADDEHVETIDFSDLSRLADSDENVPFPVPAASSPTPAAAPIGASHLVYGLSTAAGHEANQIHPNTIDNGADSNLTDTPASDIRSPRVSLRKAELSQAQETHHPLPQPAQPVFHVFGRHPGPQLPATRFQFKEAPMAALDDVMLRIKGALITMHPGETTVNGAHNLDDEAYRASRLAEIHAAHPHTSAERENFTQSQIPRPSTPQHTKPRVRLKALNRRPTQLPISTRLLHLWKLPPKPVRWDILSWDPPVANMSRRSLSLEEVLFPRNDQTVVVALPIRKAMGGDGQQMHPFAPSPVPAARVQLPSGAPASFKPFPQLEAPQKSLGTVNPTSKSPPPSSPDRGASLSLPKMDKSSSTLSDNSQSGSSRIKVTPKLPLGTDVAFYKPPSTSTAVASSNVRFFVNSEVDEAITSPLLESTFATATPISNDVNNEKVHLSVLMHAGFVCSMLGIGNVDSAVTSLYTSPVGAGPNSLGQVTHRVLSECVIQHGGPWVGQDQVLMGYLKGWKCDNDRKLPERYC